MEPYAESRGAIAREIDRKLTARPKSACAIRAIDDALNVLDVIVDIGKASSGVRSFPPSALNKGLDVVER
jgi:hypothetical protein